MTNANSVSIADQQSAKLSELVNFVRTHSPYYANLYESIPKEGWQLSDLPIIDGSTFWEGSSNLDTWQVLTDKFNNGLIFRTGGTTGTSKLSVFTRAEWKALTTTYGTKSIAQQLKAGDKVANLFYCGDLYSSFMLIHGSMLNMDVPVCDYAFGQLIDSAKLIEQLIALNVNVLVGPPAILLGHAAYLEKHNMQLPHIRLLLFGCESVFASQMELLKKVMPNARVASIGHACVDAGIVGACNETCKSGEHFVFEPETIVEIIDEHTGQPITEPGHTGMLIVTDLERRLMPIIRYPVGDRAAWCEDTVGPCRKFVLKGRSGLSQRIRVGLTSIFPDFFDSVIFEIIDEHKWQLVLEHINACDHVILRIARKGSEVEAQKIIDTLYEKDWALRELRDRKLLELSVEWAGYDQLETNPRTGKLMRVIDNRDYDLNEAAK